MEWVFFIAGALTLIAIKGFLAYVSLLMKYEWRRRQIERLTLANKMHEARNAKLESMWLEAEARADNAGEIWPEVIG